MRLTRLATPPGNRDSASAVSSKGDRLAAVSEDRRLPFDTGVSRAVVSPGTNGSVIRVSRRVASAAIGGTAPRKRGDPPRGRIRSEDLGRERSCRARHRILPKEDARPPIRFRRDDFACSFTLSPEFFSTFPRGTISALSESSCD